jgi:hypothetical protein
MGHFFDGWHVTCTTQELLTSGQFEPQTSECEGFTQIVGPKKPSNAPLLFKSPAHARLWTQHLSLQHLRFGPRPHDAVQVLLTVAKDQTEKRTKTL